MGPRHFHADPDLTDHPQADSGFHLMRIRIFIWCGCRSRSGSDFSPWCWSGSGSRSQLANKGSYSQKCSNRQIFHTFWKIDADPYPVLDPVPAYHFDSDPDPNVYLMRIQVTKMMRIHASPYPRSGRGSGSTKLFFSSVVDLQLISLLDLDPDVKIWRNSENIL